VNHADYRLDMTENGEFSWPFRPIFVADQTTVYDMGKLKTALCAVVHG
jgi:hypothetical protein